ncbi:hypothetical protein FB390_1618 [Nocardia bhagyanarayanae]|uniref:Uncharacterized protein n=2 Tax=Nocardia bhagyanarayanae TaxID=1215925 RepID=A0A543F844_9NOCA|nr:hypothetical protein FB390_1618 [Nocardia bhagyanarayanae]
MHFEILAASDVGDRIATVGVVLLGLALIPVVLFLVFSILALLEEAAPYIGMVLIVGGGISLVAGYVAANSSFMWGGGIALVVGIVALFTS